MTKLATRRRFERRRFVPKPLVTQALRCAAVSLGLVLVSCTTTEPAATNRALDTTAAITPAPSVAEPSVSAATSTVPVPVVTADERLEASHRWVIEALALVRSNAFYADRVDWPLWERRASDRAVEARGPADLYGLVETVLFELGDHHSLFRTPSQAAAAQRRLLDAQDEPGPLPTIEVRENVGYLHLPSITALPSSTAAESYAQTGFIGYADTEACGWIIDLRGNRGGSVPPMLHAIAPLLGAGSAVRYLDRNGDESGFRITNRLTVEAYGITDLAVSETGAPDRMFSVDLGAAPTAVLIDRFTASAAEGILVAMGAEADTMTFGEASAGVPTGNQQFDLSDGAAVVLTVGVSVDRDGNVFEGPIEPDTGVEQLSDAGLIDQPGEYSVDDPTATEALYWLHDQPACSN